MRLSSRVYALTTVAVLCGSLSAADQLTPIKYNNPGLVVDLGVGLWAWPLPMDYDGDGDLDLVVSCPDVPHSGTFFFENPGNAKTGALPTFQPAVRIADRMSNVQVSDVNGTPVVSSPGKIYLDFPNQQYQKPISLGLPAKLDLEHKRTRANQWKLVDWEGDGDLDVIVGMGVWDEYGWDDAWDENGDWKNGPLHGYVYLVENIAVNKAEGERAEWKKYPDQKHDWPKSFGPRPVFAKPVQLTAGEKPIDVYGMPSPNFADFDGDGDLDLICGEFMDGFTAFENIGSREKPKYNSGMQLVTNPGNSLADPVKMDLQMITPVAVDWDGDGDVDLISGDEDGRVAFIELKNAKTMAFAQPQYFKQVADDVKFGALITPVSVDWDGDGDEDLVCGNTAGYIGFIENLDGKNPPKFAAPVRLTQSAPLRGGDIVTTIRNQAGPRGSIQGPCEAKWGYTTISVADWNGDERLDVIVNGIWGKVQYHARAKDGSLHRADAIDVTIADGLKKPDWLWWNPGSALATQWRTTPCVADWNDDGLNDIIMLDEEGYLALYRRENHGGKTRLMPPERVFKMSGPCEFDSRQRAVGKAKDGLLRLNGKNAGGSGRRKMCIVDWDGDGRKDILVNSSNVNWLRNVRTDDDGFTWFEDQGPMDSKRLAGHTTSPTTVDWNRDGVPELLVGAEDGRLFYQPRAEKE